MKDSRIISSWEKINVLRILYLEKLFFLSKREVKTFSDEKWIGLTTTKLSLNHPLMRVLQEEEKWSQKEEAKRNGEPIKW